MKYYVKKYIKYILLFLMLNILIVISQFLTPFLIRSILEMKEITQSAYIHGFLILLSIIIMYALKYLANYFMHVFNKNIKIIESKRIYEYMLKIDYSILKDFDTTYYVSRISDSIKNISDFICISVSDLTISVIIIFVSLSISIKYSVLITILFIALFIVNVLLYKKLNTKLQKICYKLQEVFSNNFKNIINICKNIDYIKQSCNYNNFSNSISKYVEKIETESNKVNIFAGSTSTVLEGLVNIIKFSILIFCIILSFENKLDLKDIIFLEIILNIYFNALIELKNTNIGLRDLRASISFLNDCVFTKSEQDDGIKILESIEMLKVDIEKFSYNNGKINILNNTKFCIKRNEKVAIVGKSGVGKSTLLNMMLGLYKNNDIYINNIPINEYSLKPLRSKIYIVNQNVNIFPGNLKTNITIGMEECYCEDELNKICSEHFMKDLIMDIGGLDVDLLDAGGNLSGGQRQKINIARMLIHDPDLIIFDESTSALDSNSENEVFKDIEKYIKDKIVVKISHRFSSLIDMDKVIILTDLESGCEEYSSINEAKEMSETFSSLFNGQINNN